MSWIRIRVRPSDGEDFLMARVAAVVSASPAPRPKEEDPASWQLDDSNDWWARLERDALAIHYRYGRQDVMEALETFLCWTIGAPADPATDLEDGRWPETAEVAP